jgi:receptor protein-tyrosine kinase
MKPEAPRPAPETSRAALAAPPFVSNSRVLHIDVARAIGRGLLPPEDMSKRMREEFRRIKWPLLDVALRRAPSQLERPNLIMVTSSVPSEGKTFCSFNLALSMAREQDCAVLLVDADMAKPKLTSALDLGEVPGLSEYLAGTQLHLQDVVWKTNLDRIYFLPSGAATSSGPELLAGQRMQQLLAELATLPNGYIVLFDSPPLLATSDARVLSRLVGQTALVVKADSTSRDAVKEAITLVNKSTALGVVLTQNSGSFGSQYYGEYYQYGDGLE